ncbi:MAG: NTP transferase domain-containing protein [Oscillospiraceae bacterium]
MKQIDAILLAAGLSRRYGRENKLLLPFRGVPLVERALSLAVGLGSFARILIVCSDPEVMEIARRYPLEIIVNEHPEDGISESIRLGVSSSSGEYYLFLPCDQPLLDGQTVSNVLEAASPSRIVCPVWSGARGSPVLFSAEYRRQLLSLPKGRGGKVIMEKYPECVNEVEASCREALMDIDTEDQAKVIMTL